MDKIAVAFIACVLIISITWLAMHNQHIWASVLLVYLLGMTWPKKN